MGRMEKIIPLCQQWIRVLSEHILTRYQIWEDISAGLVASWETGSSEAKQAVSCRERQEDELRGKGENER